MNRIHWSNNGSVLLRSKKSAFSRTKKYDQETAAIVDADTRNNSYMSVELGEGEALVVLLGSTITLERLSAYFSYDRALTWEYSTDTTDGYSDGTWSPMPEMVDGGGSALRDITLGTPIAGVKAIRFSSPSYGVKGSLFDLKIFGAYEEPSFEITDDLGVPLDGEYPISFSESANIGSAFDATVEFYISNTDVVDHTYRVTIGGVGDSRALMEKSGNLKISEGGGTEYSKTIDVDVVAAGISGAIAIHANIAAADFVEPGLQFFSIDIEEIA